MGRKGVQLPCFGGVQHLKEKFRAKKFFTIAIAIVSGTLKA